MTSSLSHQIHNCHTHIFTIDYIPEYFLNRFIPTTVVKNLVEKEWVARLGETLLKNSLNRYAAFLYSALKNSEEEVLKELRAYYPKNAKFCVLSVDFDFMGAGKARLDFTQQIQALSRLASMVNYEREVVLPFLGVDPRRKNIYDLVRTYIEDHHFKGLKLYPALGFFPDDPRLDKVYEYAETHHIPITVHCIPKNKNYYRNNPSKENIEKASIIPFIEDKKFHKKAFKNLYHFAQFYNHPYWHLQTLKKFPELTLNFGHFGGNLEWNKYLDNPVNIDTPTKREEHLDLVGSHTSYNNWFSFLRDLLKYHPNTYADISFTVHDRKLYPLLKILLTTESLEEGEFHVKEKILFGTDFYMLQKDYRERRFGIELRGYLTDKEYWQIAEVNPKRFLYG